MSQNKRAACEWTMVLHTYRGLLLFLFPLAPLMRLSGFPHVSLFARLSPDLSAASLSVSDVLSSLLMHGLWLGKNIIVLSVDTLSVQIFTYLSNEPADPSRSVASTHKSQSVLWKRLSGPKSQFCFVQVGMGLTVLPQMWDQTPCFCVGLTCTRLHSPRAITSFVCWCTHAAFPRVT